MAAYNEEPSSHLVLFLQYSTVQYSTVRCKKRDRGGKKGREEGKGRREEGKGTRLGFLLG